MTERKPTDAAPTPAPAQTEQFPPIAFDTEGAGWDEGGWCEGAQSNTKESAR